MPPSCSARRTAESRRGSARAGPRTDHRLDDATLDRSRGDVRRAARSAGRAATRLAIGSGTVTNPAWPRTHSKAPSPATTAPIPPIATARATPAAEASQPNRRPPIGVEPAKTVV